METEPDSVAPSVFELEPSLPAGHVPVRVVDELRHAYRVAKDHKQAFSDALKAQAEKHGIEPAALRRYVAALEGDDAERLHKELDDLLRLLDDDEAE